MLVLLLAHCHLPSSDSYNKEGWKTSLISTSPRPLIVQWLGDTCRKRDWILVSAGSGRNRLQISLWKPPEYGCCPQGHWAVFSLDGGYGAAQTAQRHRGTHLSHSHTSLQLGICPHMFITYRAYTTQFNFVDYSSSLFVDSSTQLIQE